jgi:hypothetical protein
MVPSWHRRAGGSRLIGCIRTASSHIRRSVALSDGGQYWRSRHSLDQRSRTIGLERITGMVFVPQAILWIINGIAFNKIGKHGLPNLSTRLKMRAPAHANVKKRRVPNSERAVSLKRAAEGYIAKQIS